MTLMIERRLGRFHFDMTSGWLLLGEEGGGLGGDSESTKTFAVKLPVTCYLAPCARVAEKASLQ